MRLWSQWMAKKRVSSSFLVFTGIKTDTSIARKPVDPPPIVRLVVNQNADQHGYVYQPTSLELSFLPCTVFISKVHICS